MNCTTHAEKEAAGTCTYCGKPFCSDCLIEIDGKMVCKSDVNNVYQESKKTSSTPKYQYRPSPAYQAQPPSAPPIIINNKNVNKNTVGKVRRKRSCLFDAFMICITCGLWIIWMIFRPKY